MTYLDAITVRTIDNRDPEEMLRWYRARVEAMTRWVEERTAREEPPT